MAARTMKAPVYLTKLVDLLGGVPAAAEALGVVKSTIHGNLKANLCAEALELAAKYCYELKSQASVTYIIKVPDDRTRVAVTAYLDAMKIWYMGVD